MPNIEQCSIKAPHEGHNWISVAPKQINYHVCRGKHWNAFEVRTHLSELIQSALEYQDRPGYVSGEPAPHMKIMEELWPKIVGFLQPEDMPLKMETSESANVQWEAGRLMVIPSRPEERIADALEKLIEMLPVCGHGNISAICSACKAAAYQGFID